MRSRSSDRCADRIDPRAPEHGDDVPGECTVHSLTVAENVGYRSTRRPRCRDRVRHRIEEVLGIVGLADYINMMLSGLSREDSGDGSRSLGRLQQNPPSVLLDDPTGRLDPITATTVDDEIVKLRDLRGHRHTNRRHPPDAGRLLHRDTRGRPDQRGAWRICRCVRLIHRAGVRFLVLNEGRASSKERPTSFGPRPTPNPLRESLFMTLPPWWRKPLQFAICTQDAFFRRPPVRCAGRYSEPFPPLL